MVPHAGEDSEVFRSVTELGATLAALAPIAGTVRRRAAAAIVFDWESWWAGELDSHPSSRLRYRQEALDWYSAFLAAGVRADVIGVADDLTGYDLLVAPILHVVPGDLARRLEEYVASGGHLVTTYFSGIVDENDHVWLGGYPGALRDLLGIRIEEFGPLLDGDTVDLDIGVTGTLWTDRIDLTDPATEALAVYKTGDHAGRPAITLRRTPSGSASYVSTRLGPAGLAAVLPDLLKVSGVASELPAEVRGLVDLAVRTDGTDDYWFLSNRGDRDADVSAVSGDPLPGPSLAQHTTLAPGQVRIHRRRRAG
jgi:beta-galactosidase